MFAAILLSATAGLLPSIITGRIVDEATSALESISESAIQEALETLMAGRTSIVIAHRLSTILKADRIWVIHDGVITKSGDHEALLAQDGIYRELYETQFWNTRRKFIRRTSEGDKKWVQSSALLT